MNPVINIIDELEDGRRKARHHVEGVMVHRCGVNLVDGIVLGYDGITVGRHFIGADKQYPAVARATGHENAYNLFIGGNLGPKESDGVIWQALTLDDIGRHARQFSSKHIAVGLICDARVKPISEQQRQSLIDVLAYICPAFDLNPYRQIRGHGEVRESHDGSKAPGQINACPGDHLNMNHVRHDVDGVVLDAGSCRAYEAGLVFTAW